LFGREKGAYTGALSKQIGRFELAHGSTLFLDEIGELPSDIQVKLLRVLESHTIERLGNPKPISVDVRIIAATNRSLADALHSGRLRQDLYYRLNVFPIFLPPLRERREDIPLFVDAFVDELAGTMGKRIEEIESASMQALVAYGWPGNVRELRNLVERAMILATGPTLRIYPEIEIDEANSGSSMVSAERTRILQILQDTG
jgi:transcriptional regulator with GAF, ATPase, and Fis domain